MINEKFPNSNTFDYSDKTLSSFVLYIGTSGNPDVVPGTPCDYLTIGI